MSGPPRAGSLAANGGCTMADAPQSITETASRAPDPVVPLAATLAVARGDDPLGHAGGRAS